MNLKNFGPVAWVAGNWQLALGVFGAALLAIGLAYVSGRGDGRAVCEAKQARLVEAARVVTEASASQAAQERESDDSVIDTRKEERDDAIKSEADTAPSAARIALNCKRLQQAGTDISQFPACGGRKAEEEAGPRP